MQEEPYINLVGIRNGLLRVFIQTDENGVGFDAPEMTPLHKEDDPLPNTRLMVEYIDVDKDEVVLSLSQFTETKITLKQYSAREIVTVDGEKITIGFDRIRDKKLYSK